MRSRNVVTPISTSYTPGRFTCPDTANKRVPVDLPLPSAANAAPPFSMIHGRFDNVSTLLTIVGCM